MTSWKIDIKVDQALIPLVQEIIYGLEADNFPTLSDFEITADDTIRHMEAFFTEKPDVAALRHKLAPHLPKTDITLSEIAETDWVSESQKLLQPVAAGPFFIYGSHDAHRVPKDRICLLVEAGQAFGTGQHETSHGCLLAIGALSQELTDSKSPGVALDLGCGSGLLALAMSRIWPITIVASDIDPIAAETTRLNARANHVALVGPQSGDAGLAVVTSDGFEAPALSDSGPYDVITANILAKPLQEMAPDIVAHLSRNGTLILSGLITAQEEAVCAAYAKEGLELMKRYVRGEWHSLMLRRKPGSGPE